MLIDATCAYVAGGGHGKGESTRYVVTCGVDARAPGRIIMYYVNH